MTGNQHFQRTGSLSPSRSVFDLSYEKKLSCDFGQLIPIMHDEVLPGDIWKIGNEIVVRFQPLVAPVLHEFNVFVHYFFVPFRLVWDDWIDFITGGEDGLDASVMPTWQPTGAAMPDGINDNAEGSLWDYFGHPTGVTPTDFYPSDLYKRAYNLIYNEYYRDQNLITEVTESTSEMVLKRSWEKDYFTSALEDTQRGTMPALPVTGTLDFANAVGGTGATTSGVNVDAGTDELRSAVGPGTNNQDIINALNKGTLSATTFDIEDLRLALRTQEWMERNMRAGVRYPEFLRAHFGVSIPDAQWRPLYIGGSKAPVQVSTTFQTSETNTTDQGTMTGNAISVDRQFCADFRAREHGCIIGIMSIMPRAAYNSQGIDRQYIRTTKFDFYHPEFANLTEQAIQKGELYASGTGANNTAVFGYVAAYDEYRTKKSIVCGEFRSTYDYWHLARQFTSLPSLNQAFVELDSLTGGSSNQYKRIFAAPGEPGCLVNLRNNIKAIRPMPVIAVPGITGPR